MSNNNRKNNPLGPTETVLPATGGGVGTEGNTDPRLQKENLKLQLTAQKQQLKTTEYNIKSLQKQLTKLSSAKKTTTKKSVDNKKTTSKKTSKKTGKR